MTHSPVDHGLPNGRRDERRAVAHGPGTQQIVMSLAPLATVTTLLMEALGKQKGSPPAWYGPVRDALDPDDVALLSPLLGSKGPSFIPDCLLPRPADFAPAFEDDLDRVASASGDDLAADIAADGLLDTAWAETTHAPRKWLSSYIACLRQAWVGARPLWEQAQPLLEREVDRVGGALVRGAFDVLLGELSPRVGITDGQWFMDGHQSPITFAHGIVLNPVVAGRRALFVAGRDGIVDDFAYPVPGAGSISDPGNGAVSGDALSVLLGAPRAELLRRLDRPATAGSLAASMIYSPSAISHHLFTLERAGLIHRERTGRHVLVHRTTRATALIVLYDD